MKLFVLFIISLTLVSVYQWVELRSPAQVVLPTSKQLNEMVGLEGARRVPLWLANAGN